MRVAGEYSFNGGADAVQQRYLALLSEIYDVIGSVDAQISKTKVSEEKTTPRKLLFAPRELNKLFKVFFSDRGWLPVRERCDYPTQHYRADYIPKPLPSWVFREMDFVKQKLGVEVQFGKYSFMVHN
jgi:hypothetical protein